MPEVAVDNRAVNILNNIVLTLANTTVGGVNAFASVGSVNDPESFLRVADPLRAGGPVAGVVEGSTEERNGNSGDERAICRFSFDIIVRIVRIRRPGATETDAMNEAKRLLQIARQALLASPGRDGNADLVQWAGEVVNGTTVNGLARQLRGPTPNEAFFTATLGGACCWRVLY